MSNLWTKLTNWFKPKSFKYPKPTLTKLQIQTNPKTAKPFNPKHYKKLIRKLTNQARIIQRNRQRREYD